MQRLMHACICGKCIHTRQRHPDVIRVKTAPEVLRRYIHGDDNVVSKLPSMQYMSGVYTNLCCARRQARMYAWCCIERQTSDAILSTAMHLVHIADSAMLEVVIQWQHYDTVRVAVQGLPCDIAHLVVKLELGIAHDMGFHLHLALLQVPWQQG